MINFLGLTITTGWGPTLRFALLVALPLAALVMLAIFCGPIGLAGGLGGSVLAASGITQRRRRQALSSGNPNEGSGS